MRKERRRVGKVAFLFPGQGSQQVGMLAEFGIYSIIQETFQECSEAVGRNLWELAQKGPKEELDRTENTQPALLAASTALYRYWWLEIGPAPEFAAGHSLGEYSALVAAGCLELADAARLVQHRGQLMQAAVPQGQGAMAAVLGLDDAAVEDCCRQAEQATGEVVSAANYNCPGQVVIAGTRAAVQAAGDSCSDRGARRVLPLAVSVPSHCALMRKAASELAEHLRSLRWKDPRFPVVQNRTALPAPDQKTMLQNLEQQLYEPVRWSQCMRQLVEMGTQEFIECGPGKVLAGLARKLDSELTVSPVAH